jgi:hypothetical protein
VNCGARLPGAEAATSGRFAEVTVTQNIASTARGSVTGVELGEVRGDVTMNVFQVTMPPELAAALQAVPTELQPKDQMESAPLQNREAVKRTIQEILDASKRSPEVRAVQVGNTRLSRVDLLLKQAVLLKQEAVQMFLDSVERNKHVTERARAAAGPGGTFQVDLADLLHGFDGAAQEAK